MPTQRHTLNSACVFSIECKNTIDWVLCPSQHKGQYLVVDVVSIFLNWRAILPRLWVSIPNTQALLLEWSTLKQICSNCRDLSSQRHKSHCEESNKTLALVEVWENTIHSAVNDLLHLVSAANILLYCMSAYSVLKDQAYLCSMFASPAK